MNVYQLIAMAKEVEDFPHRRHCQIKAPPNTPAAHLTAHPSWFYFPPWRLFKPPLAPRPCASLSHEFLKPGTDHTELQEISLWAKGTLVPFSCRCILSPLSWLSHSKLHFLQEENHWGTSPAPEGPNFQANHQCISWAPRMQSQVIGGPKFHLWLLEKT